MAMGLSFSNGGGFVLDTTSRDGAMFESRFLVTLSERVGPYFPIDFDRSELAFDTGVDAWTLCADAGVVEYEPLGLSVRVVWI